MSDTTPRTPVRILHLEDSRVDHALVKFALQRSQMPCELTLVDTLEDFQRELEARTHDVVLADYHLPGFNGLDAWELVRHSGIVIPFVILSGAIGEAAAVEAMHRGVDDYLLKDNMQRLAHVIERALEVAETRRAKAQADAELAESRQRLAELAEHLQTSIEQERADIAREIHDDIGGSLAAVKLDLSWIARRSTLDTEMRQHVDTALDMLQHALGASQRIMMNLRPPILDQGLVAAVQWMGASFEKRTGVRVTVRRSGDAIEVPHEVQLVAYRTAQEALTNVLKHAHATTVEIDLSDREGVLTLEVSDNGHGMGPEALRKAKSFGLLGLKERAAKVGGWMDVSSSPRGTSVILSVPLNAAAGEGLADNNREGNGDDQSDFV
ncbi:sensor histidine kinase [Hydrogenophaga sp.]|uniref:hybrid sensor histidine kinase/response regulator n=1 Tax=Hydrogenophaga sp. TaxID=1904254 RepID=UPI00286D8843|nr:sensor histidine kinase [Hydrogenophaga sp.]